MNRFIIKIITLSLLTFTSAVLGYSQYPSQSHYDERYAPKSLRGLKALNVQTEAYVFPTELLGGEIKHSDVKSRVEGMLKKAGIDYLSERDAKLAPDAPVLTVSVVATKMGDSSYSLVSEIALLQKVIVEDSSKLRITGTTWSDSEIVQASGNNPRELIFESVDGMVFEFIKAYMIGNSKPEPKISKFFKIVNTNEPTEAEARPKNLKWSAPQNGLQMIAWLSPLRPVVFSAIRNASQQTIHYCDYLLGYVETVRLHARLKGDSEWRPIPLRPNDHRAYIGVLLCSRRGSVAPGQEMAPYWSHIPVGAPKLKRKYTFTEYLTDYDFPTDWKGRVECKIIQTLFGGRHKDTWEGSVESSIFEINLPLKSSDAFEK